MLVFIRFIGRQHDKAENKGGTTETPTKKRTHACEEHGDSNYRDNSTNNSDELRKSSEIITFGMRENHPADSSCDSANTKDGSGQLVIVEEIVHTGTSQYACERCATQSEDVWGCGCKAIKGSHSIVIFPPNSVISSALTLPVKSGRGEFIFG
jgi:hypothetical protein